MKPYYQDALATIYHADSRELLPELEGQYNVVVTDPPWPIKTKIPIQGSDRPFALMGEVCNVIDRKCPRLIFIFGDQSDPRITAAVPSWFPFLRVALMRRIPPPRRGTIMGLGDIVYVFGGRHLVDNGKRMLTGMCDIPSNHEDAARARRDGCYWARNIRGMNWIVGRYTRTTDTILDPFLGTGTTLMAAKYGGRKCIGIEIEEKWCEVSARALSQRTIEECM